MKHAGVRFHEGIPTTFHLRKMASESGILMLDDHDGRGK